MYEVCIDQGYGVCVSAFKIESVERIEKLLSLAPEYREKVHRWFKAVGIENPTVNSYDEYDYNSCNGITTILREVLFEITGIEFYECDDCDGNDYILYKPSYPWNLPDEESDLTKEELREIFIKYCSMVTDSEIDPDYQSVENCC